MDTITGKDILDLDERALRAAALRRQGETYDMIAQTLGYVSPSGAYKAVQRARQYMEVSIGALEENRTEELDRLESLLRAIWARAVAGDLKTIDRVLNISDAKRKLLGLDAPAKLDHRVLLQEAQALADETGVSVEELVAEATRMATNRGLLSGTSSVAEEEEDAGFTGQ